MIHHVVLSCENDEDANPLTEPSERYLRIDVIAGTAHLSVFRLDERGVPRDSEYSCVVSARSVVHAIQVQLDDDADGLPADWQRPTAGSDAPAVDDSAFPHQNYG